MSNQINLAVDASRSSDLFKKTGVEKVSDELLKEISKQNNEIIFYTPKLISELPKDKQKILRWPPIYLWTQIRLSIEIILNCPDILFIPVHTIPWFHPKKTFVVIHDIGFIKYPEVYSKKEIGKGSFFNFLFKSGTFIKTLGKYKTTEYDYLKYSLEQTIKHAYKIFVPTQAVKNDILKYFPNKNLENKIIVIHHGYTPFCHSDRSEYAVAEAEALNGVEESLKHQQKKKQILYIGRIEEKKNIKNLIKAFEIFSEKHPDYKLVLAGRNKLNLNPKNPNIKFLGYISDEKKKELLQESECLVLISKEEGFGFPILEGWDAELPVLVSDIPVLKEIGGEACLFCNPNSVEDIAKKLNKIILDKDLQQKLIQKGKHRIKEFSWEKAAEKYLANLSEE